jgi:hypothetical protein
MALPSAVTIGSAAFVVAAGVGLVAVASSASEDPAAKKPAAHDSVTPPADVKPDKQALVKPDHEPAKKPKPHERPDPIPQVFVEVYNNSGVTGLAADKAQVLERAGWNVAATDNWYGNIPDNTVYYPDKLARQAHQLAKVLHITRLRPAVSPMQFDRLTVIFTSSR